MSSWRGVGVCPVVEGWALNSPNLSHNFYDFSFRVFPRHKIMAMLMLKLSWIRQLVSAKVAKMKDFYGKTLFSWMARGYHEAQMDRWKLLGDVS